MGYFTFIATMDPGYQEIIDHNKSVVDLTVFSICPYDIKEGKDKRWRSDVARIMWMRDHPDWIWVDADCWIIKPIDFVSEKPMFLNCRGYPDIAAIVGNGDPSIFSEMLEGSNVNGGGPRKVSVVNKDVGWAQGWLNANRSRIDFIPSGYFDHKGLSKTR
jgi:hypothetical protein